MESFRQALAAGADGLELDVRLTSDGEVVVFHDATLDRTTSGSGAVAATSWAQLRTLDAGAHFTPDSGLTWPWRGRGITVSRLEEVIEQLPGVPMMVEIKVREAAGPTAELLERTGAIARCVAGSFQEDVHAVLRTHSVPRLASIREMQALYLPSLFGRRYGTLPFAAMSLPRFFKGIPVPVGALAAAAAPAGATMHVWVVNHATSAVRLWRRGVHGVLSDDPGPIARALATLGQGTATASSEIG